MDHDYEILLGHKPSNSSSEITNVVVAYKFAFPTISRTALPDITWAQRRTGGSTLVVTTTDDFLREWSSEIKTHAPDSITYTDFQDGHLPLESCDFVLATYERVRDEYLRGGRLHSTRWKRLILDQAQFVLRYLTNKTKLVVLALKALHRWALCSSLTNILTPDIVITSRIVSLVYFLVS
ncbi:unnamed protein product [Arabis nemorensis]|uniref:SNF2 N-terminal domain-containing protein n=1 Tax=Arabis nemorensis TaxID=586526 RepID=A0A565B1Z7_9BRAS|nr:unnamed protein product [Arabis nemorensis]